MAAFRRLFMLCEGKGQQLNHKGVSKRFVESEEPFERALVMSE